MKEVFDNVISMNDEGDIIGIRIVYKPDFTPLSKNLQEQFLSFAKKIKTDEWYVENRGEWTSDAHYKHEFMTHFTHREHSLKGLTIWFSHREQREDTYTLAFETTDELKEHKSHIEHSMMQTFRTKGYEHFEKELSPYGIRYHFTGTSEQKKVALFQQIFVDIAQSYQWIVRSLEQLKNTIKPLSIQNIILSGVPGVGKTYNSTKLAVLIENGLTEEEIFQNIRKNSFDDHRLTDKIIHSMDDRVEFITFHSGSTYDDFVEAFSLTGEVNKGIFYQLCKKALADKTHNYYLIIDEINRGYVSKIFGETLTLLDENKRENSFVTLGHSKERFTVPQNLYIIGTMNHLDNATVDLDLALRRRFHFIEMEPNSELVSPIAKESFENLNQALKEKLGEEYMVGHSYFMNIETREDLKFVFDYKLKPLLRSYAKKEGVSFQELLNSFIF
jgi:hypothetical protein